MDITKTQENNLMTLSLSGRLDTLTAPELGTVIDALTPDVKELVLDMGELEYVSSAGLRVILSAHKKMSKQGAMKLIHLSEAVHEVFDITGFSSILNIEK